MTGGFRIGAPAANTEVGSASVAVVAITASIHRRMGASHRITRCIAGSTSVFNRARGTAVDFGGNAAEVLRYATVIAGGYACEWVFATRGRTANAESKSAVRGRGLGNHFEVEPEVAYGHST